jgi:hypothetical protein
MTTASGDVPAIERLLALVGVVNSDLDLASVLRRISEAGRDLLDGDSAACSSTPATGCGSWR